MLKLERAVMDRLIRWRHILFFLTITLLAFHARKGGMDRISGDMYYFLLPWFEKIVENGGLLLSEYAIGMAMRKALKG